MRQILLALLFVLAGCSAHAAPNLDTPGRELRISNELPPEYQAAAIAAVDAWGAPVAVSIVPEAEANFLAGDCADPAAHGCAWPGELVLVDLERMAECRWSKVDGVTRCDKMPPEFLALHEIGHFLGAGHTEPGNVMAPEFDPATPAVLTAVDLAEIVQ